MITNEPVREQVTWVRWDKIAMRNRTSHPTWWRVTEPDGYVRYFDTKREACDWIDYFNSDA